MAVSEITLQRAASLVREFRQVNRGDDPMTFWEDRLPKEPSAQSELAEAFDRAGVALFNEGKVEDAMDAFWPNFLLRLEIVKRQPADRGAIRDFASAEDLIGLACLELGKITIAEQMLSESLSYRRGLFNDEPTDAHAAYLYGVALNHNGRLQRAKGDKHLELETLKLARAHLIAVDKAWPQVSFIEDELKDVTERLLEVRAL